MPTTIDTTPSERDIGVGTSDTWAIDFTPALPSGATVTAGTASLVTAMYTNDGVAVPGFVVQVTFNTTQVLVKWDSSVLTKWSQYRLKTVATFSTGATSMMITKVRAVA